MSLLWFAPIAFAGLALLVVPVVIHLLTRREQQPVPFPSLRFLRTARLPALTRRLVDDWPLLLMRLGIVAAAVLALAGPLLVTDTRRGAWSERIVRAVVATPGIEAPAEELASAFGVATFTADVERLANTLSAAVAWLETQPPAQREIVVVGDLRASMLNAADFMLVPSHIGVRFLLKASNNRVREVTLPMLVRTADGAANAELQLRLDDDRTYLRGSRPVAGESGEPLQVRALPAEQPVADAALRAVLREGVVLDARRERRVTVAWRGADVSDLMSIREAVPAWVNAIVEELAYPARFVHGTLLVQVDTAADDDSAAVVLESIARAAFNNAHAALEPRVVADADLQAWTRPPGDVPRSARPEDEGDHRAVWAVALALMCLEQIYRRQHTRPSASAPAPEEIRVA